MKFSALFLALTLALGGCASVAPMQHNDKLAVDETKAAMAAGAISDSWSQTPVLSEGRSAVVLMTPMSLPDEIRNRRVNMELEPGANVKDLVAVLGKLGITVILSDQDAARREFYLPRFNGTVGNLLAAITRATDVWFTWSDGAIVVSPTERMGISVPQESHFGETLSKGLDSLGVRTKSVNWQSGMVIMDVTPSQFRKVKTFLERALANAAVVTIQVAVLNVNMSQNASQGINWQGLQVAALHGGDVSALKNWQNNVNGASGTTATGTTTGTSTTGTTTGTTSGTSTTGSASSTAASALPDAVGALGLAGGAATAAIFSSHFNFQGMFNFLQTYGTTETKQNVVMKTVTGNKVQFKALTQIPYVSSVGATTTATTSTTSSGALTNAVGSATTATADDGIEVEMTPNYDAAANSVTIDFKVAIKAVVAFNNLSAGNQLGTLTQPTTAEHSLTDVLRLRPGQTMVVGGLTYDSVADNRGAPVFLTHTRLENQDLKVTRQTMFIIVRPTVLKLGQVLTRESGDELGVLPQGEYIPEPGETLKRPATALKQGKDGAHD